MLGSSAIGRITGRLTREPVSSAIPPPACSTTRSSWTGSARATSSSWRRRSAPSSACAAYDTLDEAIELANLPGLRPVVVDLHHRPGEAFRFRAGIGAGMVSVNNSTSGAEAHLPFGGNGRSGNGSRQSGRWVLDQFTRWQAMNWDYSGRLQKAQMDTARR